MQTGPKSILGLGTPLSLRGPLAALNKGGGVPARALLLNARPLTLNSAFLTMRSSLE